MAPPLSRPWLLLAAAAACQIGLSAAVRDVQRPWAGVPSVPTVTAAKALALGDDQLFYRASTLTLQQMGAGGGRTATPIAAYDTDRLAGWFRLLAGFDPDAHYAPTLAAYLYGDTPRREALRPLIAALAAFAESRPASHWRYLAHAVYLARHRLGDRALALELAVRLAQIDAPGLPIWVKQMPAFALAEVGQKEAARDLMTVLLATLPDLPPEEVRFIESFIAERTR